MDGDVAPFLPAVIAANLVPYAFEVLTANGRYICEDYVRASSYCPMSDVESLALSFAQRDYGNTVQVASIKAVDETYVQGMIPQIARN